MELIKGLMQPGFIWAVVGLFLLLAELVIPGLILFFFGVGALLVSIVCWLTDISLNQQLLLFLISSTCFLFALRKWLKSVFMGSITDKQNLNITMDGFVGQDVTVKDDIAAGQKGKVEFNGADWMAETDVELAAGDTAIITSQSSLTLKISKKV